MTATEVENPAALPQANRVIQAKRAITICTSTATGQAGNPTGALQELIGPPVLFIPCRWGEKRPAIEWSALTIEHMNDPGYLRRLSTGNIGVALGRRSGGLITVDIDLVEEIEPFLEINPRLRETLMTRGKRGCNLWFRLRQNCPPSQPIKRHGRAWGELRSEGNMTILFGQHPDGMRYTIPQRYQPIQLGLDELNWPQGITFRGNFTEDAEETEIQKRTEETEDTHEVVVGCGVGLSQDAIDRSLPSQPHESHHRLFRLAREVVTHQKKHGGEFALPELRGIFDRWHSAALPFLRPNQSADEYFLEFLAGRERVRHAIGDEVFAKALERATNSPPPAELSALISQPSLLTLACLCRELQRAAGEQPFFLSCRKVAELFGKTPTTGNLWLHGLECLKVIKTIERGGPTTNKATRFRYLLPM